MRIAFLVLAVFTLSPSAEAVDWLTLPSRYTHNPSTGERISQYRKIQAPSVPQPANFRTSGYTHTRSSLNYGQSADNYHRVEQWGDPVRPYGEWRFPFRPYSTPYPNWGPPYAGLNIGGGYVWAVWAGALWTVLGCWYEFRKFKSRKSVSGTRNAKSGCLHGT